MGETRVMKTYVMKDLGYKWTSTTAMYRVEMSDGSLWDVPVQVIVDSRDEHYQEDKEDTVRGIRAGTLSDYEIYDWAGNNMNWSDVKDFAVKAETKAKLIDWEEGWCNGQNNIVGDI